ncbi:MAG: YqaA family protein [Alphaproteobacteria bacterium]
MSQLEATHAADGADIKGPGWLRGLYLWTLRQAASPHALWILALVAFIESSIFPIPPDILLIPMVLAMRQRAWLIAGICTVASVIGGTAGYGIGYFLYESVGQSILEFYGKLDKFQSFQALYNEWGAWIVMMGGLTPFPYKVITIASGVTGLNFVTFTIFSIIARGMRFFLISWLLWKFGAPIKIFIEKYLGLLTVVFFVLLFAGFLALKFL